MEVKTGDKQGAGTDCKVFVILHDDCGRVSLPIRLHNRLIANSRNACSKFRVQSKMPELRNIVLLEFWIKKFGLGALWYVDHFKVTNVVMRRQFIFPVHRWVSPGVDHFLVENYDVSIPQSITENNLLKQRKKELEEQRKEYKYVQNAEGVPVQVRINVQWVIKKFSLKKMIFTVYFKIYKDFLAKYEPS